MDENEQLTTVTLSAVRAKMKVSHIERNEFAHGMGSKKVHMGAVYGKEGENADYSKATPSGALWLQIDQGVPAADWFKPGKSYYLTLTEAPD